MLHGVAQVHDQYLVGNVAHDAQVVRDKQIGQAQRLLQVLQQIENLGLDGHVQCRHRLVGHDQRGVEHQGPRNGNALALTAGEHMRIALGRFCAQSNALEHLCDQTAPIGRRKMRIDLQRRFQNLPDALSRVE